MMFKPLLKRFKTGYSNYIFFAAALVLSTCDFAFEWHWYAVLSLGALFILVTAPLCGMSVFFNDAVKQHNRFLEYLPIRRREIWLSNYAVQLASFFIVFVALIWHRIVFFIPPDEEFLAYMIQSRWALLLGGCALAFWLYSASNFFCPYVGIKSPVTLCALFLPGALAITLLILMTGVFGLCPNLLEIAPHLFFWGLLFSAGSFVLFSLARKHWSKPKHFFLCGLPLWILLLALCSAHLFLVTYQWKDLKPEEELEIESVSQLTEQGKPGLFLVKAESQRSGSHMYFFDSKSNDWTHLARTTGYRGPSAFFDADGHGRIIINANPTLDYLFVANSKFLSMDLDSNEYRVLPKQMEQTDDDKVLYRSGMEWSNDFRHLVYVEQIYKKDFSGDSEQYLIVTDPEMNEELRMPLTDGQQYHLSRSNRILAVTPKPEKSDDNPEPKPYYVLVDLSTMEQKKLDLSQPAISFCGFLIRLLAARR